MSNKIIVNEIFPRVQKFQIDLPNEHNVAIIHLTLEENGFQKYDVFGFDGNLLIENLIVPPYVDETADDSELLTTYKWFMPYYEAIYAYADTNGMGLEW